MLLLLNLQGQQKGLSLGGVTVINKSLSLTVNMITLAFYSYNCDNILKTISRFDALTKSV